MFRRRADTPKKYEHIDFTPPEGAANAAAKGLEYREKASPSNKGGLTPAEASKEGIGSGVQRAVNLKNRDTLSPDTIKQMHGFFSRHEKNKGVAPEHKGEPWNDKGHVSWLLWGGDAARSWVDKVLGQMEKADEKANADSKKAGLYTARVASTTGDGTSVGFFIPLSADLASQYEVKPEDTSPPHVTFLYVGKVAPEQVPALLRVAREVLRNAPPVFGVLNGVDSFVKEDKNQRVLYSRVVFSHDLKPLRDRLWAALTNAGFKVEQAFPNFTPHVTIEYRDGVNNAVLDFAPPSGSWGCKTIEVWGLPKKYSLPLGEGGHARTASGPALSLDDLGYGSLTTDEEALLLAPSTAFPANVLAFIPQVPCPENSSEETRRELAHLLRLQHSARPYLAQRVAMTDENATATLEAYCAEHGLDASGVLPITNAARSVLLQVKRLYNRPRPYQLAEFLEPGFHPMSSTTAHTPSYPSGHSAQAVLVALLLSGLYPEHREAFMALAQEVGTHRMVGGYHFPSDIAYGEQVGRALYEGMARASVRTAAAKYKEKKKVPKADGSGKTTVYVYSERQVANRHREKAERLEDFKPALAELRAQVKKDLDANDPKKNLVALAVGLIDATYERVGNEDSADKGHYGVTGWLRKHVTFKGKRAVIRYVGKSGVKHEKSVDDEALVGALKKCCGDKDGEEAVLSLGKHSVTSDEVNEYLKPYGITAKDLRGLHANREMQERLRAIRSKGPKLPRLRKERDPILKEEFQKALEGAAEAVGHEPATLRKQYLVPGIEEAYMKDGTVPRDLTASARVAARYLHATKTDAEREDEEAERLIKPEPKYKPPRNDLRRRRVKTDDDDDPDKKQDDKDRSQNYKDAAQRVAAAWLFRTAASKKQRKEKAKAQRLSQKDKRKEQNRASQDGAPPKSESPKSEGSDNRDKELQQRAQNEFDAYAEKHPDTELDVSVFLKRLKAKEKRESEGSGGSDDADQDAEGLKQAEAERKAERVKQAVKDIAAEWDGAENSVPMTEENHAKISEAIQSFTPKARERFIQSFTKQRAKMVEGYEGYDPDTMEGALYDLKAPLKDKSPEGVAQKAVRAIFADRVLLNPLMLTPDNPLSSEAGKTDTPYPPSKAAPRVKQAIERFSRASDEEVAEMTERVSTALRNCRPKSPQHEELLAIQFGMNALKALPAKKRKGDRAGEGDEGDEGDDGKSDKARSAKPPKGMSGIEFGLLQHLHKNGADPSELVALSFRNSREDKSAVDDTKKFVQKQAESMGIDELNALLPPSMKSISASFLALEKSLPFVSTGLLSGFSAKERAKQRREQEAGWSKSEAKIADELRTSLVGCVSETVGKDEKALTRANKAVRDYARDNPMPKGSASKSSKSWVEWLTSLRAGFMQALNTSPKTASYREWSSTVPGYSFDSPPSSVGALYTT